MENSLAYARAQDQADPLKDFRTKFHLPEQEDGKTLLYFCGNSLGLQPKKVSEFISSKFEQISNLFLSCNSNILLIIFQLFELYLLQLQQQKYFLFPFYK